MHGVDFGRRRLCDCEAGELGALLLAPAEVRLAGYCLSYKRVCGGCWGGSGSGGANGASALALALAGWH